MKIRSKKASKKKLKVSLPAKTFLVLKTETAKSTSQPKSKFHRKESVVLQWGGHIECHELTNTCAIDNGFTILHNCFMERENFGNVLKKVK